MRRTFRFGMGMLIIHEPGFTKGCRGKRGRLTECILTVPYLIGGEVTASGASVKSAP